MKYTVQLIERFSAPTPEAKIGWFRLGGLTSQPKFIEPPGTTRPAFVLDNWCSPVNGDTNSAPLDVWLIAVGPMHQRGPANHPDSFTHAPGWAILEDQPGLPEVSTLRVVYYRRVHARLRQDGLTQAVASEIFIPSFGEQPSEPQGQITKCGARYSLELIERCEPTPEIKAGVFFFGGLPTVPTFFKAPG